MLFGKLLSFWFFRKHCLYGVAVVIFSPFVLVNLTRAMETPIPGESPTPEGVDLARVGLDAPPKAPLPTGAGTSAGAAPAAGDDAAPTPAGLGC